MAVTQRMVKMSPGLLKVMERAKREPEARFTSLAHHLDEEALKRGYHRIRKKAAVGQDGVTHEEYGESLDENIRDLHKRLKTKRYRHQPILRVRIPKGKGKTRLIGISSIEDKIVQQALREVLEAIYEVTFREVSYGFRPGRGAHDALRTLNRVLRKEGNWVLESDIQTFFDSIDRTMLMEMLRERVADPSLLRLIGKCLHVGVLDGAEYSEPEEGTTQGSVLSPILGNVYLHHVLDLWFERDVLPRLRGMAHLIRYADDFVIVFEREDDAKRVMGVIGRRFDRFGLNLHPDKTRLFPFKRPPKGSKGKGPGAFDFLGFTVIWQRSRGGWWRPALRTRKASLSKAITAVSQWCRSHRHQRVKQQHATLKRKLAGHYNYFGVNGNYGRLMVLYRCTRRIWFKWLNRRSQRASKTWKQFADLMQDYPLPVPSIRVQIWTTP